MDIIYNNPGYYAGYVLRNIEGNRVFRGSVPAEQNHSSVIAYLGEGGNWSIMEHMQKLRTRQQDHVKKKRKEEDRLHVQTYKYKSNLLGQAGIDDCAAKNALSAYAYNELFRNQRRKRMVQYISDQQVKIKIPAM